MWLDWGSGFGPSAAGPAAAIAINIDSFLTPRPVSWVTGPGTVTASGGQCSWAATYAFVDKFVALRALVLGDISKGTATLAALDRFDYWAYTFSYFRGLARFECDWAAYNSVVAAVQAIKDPVARQAAARANALPARISLVVNASEMMWDALARVSSVGDLGTVANVLTQSLWKAVGDGATQTLVGLLGEPLPVAAQVPMSYPLSRPSYLRVLTARSFLAAGETFRLSCLVLTGAALPSNVTLFTAPLGTVGPSTQWTTVAVAPAPQDGAIQRAVYSTALPVSGSFMWYLAAEVAGQQLVYPATAPALPQTVVILT